MLMQESSPQSSVDVGVCTTMSIDDGFGFGEKGVMVDLAADKQYRR
jgi:hypothetical protein